MADRGDEIVKLTSAPNVTFAEMIVSTLQANGIEAYYQTSGGWWGSTSVSNPAGLCDIYIQRADAERALKLIPAE